MKTILKQRPTSRNSRRALRRWAGPTAATCAWMFVGGAGNVDRMRISAKELLDLHPDVILAHGTPPTAAFQGETRTIRSYLRPFPTLSGRASLQTCLARVEISPASLAKNPRWRESGWSCSRRSRPLSSGSQPFSIRYGSRWRAICPARFRGGGPIVQGGADHGTDS